MGGNIGSIFLFIILIFLSAFFSSTETAITSFSKIRLRHLMEDEDKRKKWMEILHEQPERYLSTILLGNNVVNIGASVLATALAIEAGLAAPKSIATGIMTFILLVFGEITPKTFATQNAEKMTMIVIKPIHILSYFFYPVVKIFIFLANLIIRLLGGKPTRKGPFLTEDEIKTLVSVGEQEGVLEEHEKEYIHHIFEFGDTVVKEVMVPRMDMVSVSSKSKINELMNLIIETGHSRIPVFRGSVDNIIGIIYAKDILVHQNKSGEEISLENLIRPAIYIPENKRVSELLTELQQKKIHLAIVVDEYGGTAGLVTIEDLLEEIVGEIFDEYDLEEMMVEKINDQNYRVDARMDLEELGEIIGFEFPKDDIETIGGFVFNLFGKIPTAGEKIEYENIIFKVERVQRRRIDKILITVLEKENIADE